MAIQVIELGEATIATNWERIEFSVALPDMNQPIIMASENKYAWDNATNNWGISKVKKKFRLTGFDYKLDEGVISS